METRQCNTCRVVKDLTSEFFPQEVNDRGYTYLRKKCVVCRLREDNIRRRSKPYIYRFIDEDNNIVYIGKTFQLTRRLPRHFNEKPMKWKQEFTGTIEVSLMNSEADMHIMEMYLINIHKPIYNDKDKSPSDLPTFSLQEPIFESHKEIKNGKW